MIGLHFGWRVLGITKAEWEKLNAAQTITQNNHFGARVLSTEPITAKAAQGIMADPQWAQRFLSGQMASGPGAAPGVANELTKQREQAIAEAEGFRALEVNDALAVIKKPGVSPELLLVAEHNVKGKDPRRRILAALFEVAKAQGLNTEPFLLAMTRAGMTPVDPAESDET